MRPRNWPLIMRLSTAIWLAMFPLSLWTTAQTSVNQPAASSDSMATWSRHHCLFILGLPGDPSHQQKFRQLANSIHQQLVKRGFPTANVTVLTHEPPTESERMLSVNKASIEKTIGNLVQALEEDDSIWVIFIGHADHDGEHVRFHLPGPDLRAIDYAELFEDLKCKQQVFWMTMSNSGWFTEPLSKENRIVITATTRDAEPNETEFPAAFATALASPTSELDRDQEGEVSVLDLFAKTNELVEKRYKSNSRAPTEHATIDDNSDGKGTEWKEILAEQNRISQLDDTAAAQSLPGSVRIDGRTAAAVIVPNQDEMIAAETAEIEIE